MNLPPFSRLVDAHHRDVGRLAHALAGPVDGDDVAQQAWTQALAAYPRLTSSTNLRGWLLTITARCAADHHRGRARRAVPSDDLPDRADRAGTQALERAGEGEGPVWTTVRSLPERQRVVVALRYVADLDHAAIAAHLATTPAASRRLLADALATLRAAHLDQTDPSTTPEKVTT